MDGIELKAKFSWRSHGSTGYDGAWKPWIQRKVSKSIGLLGTHRLMEMVILCNLRIPGMLSNSIQQQAQVTTSDPMGATDGTNPMQSLETIDKLSNDKQMC